jgi:hypothetical protein
LACTKDSKSKKKILIVPELFFLAGLENDAKNNKELM